MLSLEPVFAALHQSRRTRTRVRILQQRAELTSMLNGSEGRGRRVSGDLRRRLIGLGLVDRSSVVNI